MSEIDDEEIENIILAELENLKDDDLEESEKTVEEIEPVSSDQDEEPVLFDDLSKAFTNYYTNFMSHIEDEINEFQTNVPEIDSILSKSNKDLQELLSKDDQDDTSNEQDDEKMNIILSSRPTTKLGVDQPTPRQPHPEGESSNCSTNNETDDEDNSSNLKDDPSEVKIIYAWIETDKQIEKINDQRWNDFKSFLSSIDESRGETRNISQQETMKEIESRKARQMELEQNLEGLISDQNAKLSEESRKILDELETDLSAEKAKVIQLNEEIEARQKEIQNNAAVIIQKNFRGYRIRLRIGDDVNALRAKARRQYQKELIVKTAKQQNKQKAKEYNKVRQQRDLESSRSSVISHSCSTELSESSSSKKTRSRKSNSTSKHQENKDSLEQQEFIIEMTEGSVKFEDSSRSEIVHKRVTGENEFKNEPPNQENQSQMLEDFKVETDQPPAEIENTYDEEKNLKPELENDRSVEMDLTSNAESAVSQDSPINKETLSKNSSSESDNAVLFVEIDKGESASQNIPDNKCIAEEKMESGTIDVENSGTEISVTNEADSCGNIVNFPLEDNKDNEEIDSSSIAQAPGTVKKTAYVLPMQQNVKLDLNETDEDKNEEDTGNPIAKNQLELTDNAEDIMEHYEVNHEDIYDVKRSLNEENIYSEDNANVIFVEEENSSLQNQVVISSQGDNLDCITTENQEADQEIGRKNSPDDDQDLNESLEIPNQNDNISQNTELITPRNLASAPDSGISTILLEDNFPNRTIPELCNDTLEPEERIAFKNCAGSESTSQNLSPSPNLKEEEEDKEIESHSTPPESLQDLWASWLKKSRLKIPQADDTTNIQRQRRYPRSAKKFAKIPPEVLSKYIIQSDSLNSITVLRLHQVSNYRLEGLDNHCPNLEVFIANCCKLPTLEGLESCNNLQYIDVKNNEIEYIDLGCTSKNRLFYVNLSNNHLVTLHGLDVCVSLKELNLGHNKITRLAPDGLQSFCKSLMHFDMSHNQLVSTIGLQLCPHLQSLNLSHNNLSEVSELPSLPYLRHLNLSHNSFNKFPPLWNNCLLQELHLDQNSLKVTLPLKSYWLPNLFHLSLSNNNLYELENFPLPILMQLNISNNQFSNLSELLENLKSFPHLQSLNLLVTPCFASQSAQKSVIDSLPHLTILNDNPIPGRPDRNFFFDENRFLMTCLKFLTACHHHQEKLADNKKKLLGSDPKSVLQLMRFYNRYYDQLRRLADQHKEFQETGQLDPISRTNHKSHQQIKQEKVSNKEEKQNQFSPESAVTKIAALYRGYRVRKQMTEQIDEIFHRSAAKIQATWRGYRVRKWIRKALEKIKIDFELDKNVDEDLMPSVDVNEFNEADVDRIYGDIKLPTSAKNSSAGERISVASVSQQKRHSLNSPILPTILPKSQKSAWTPEQQVLRNETPGEIFRPLSGTSRTTDLIIQLDSFRTNSVASRNASQPLAPISTSRKSKKAESIIQEWGFQGESCAKSMMQRAQKMKYNSERRQKLSQMDAQSKLNLLRKLELQNPPQSFRVSKKNDPVVKITGKMEYFRAKALEKMQLEAKQHKEVQNRTYEWVFEQVTPKPKPPSPSQSTTLSGRITLPKISQNDSGRLVVQQSPSLKSRSKDQCGKSLLNEEDP